MTEVATSTLDTTTIAASAGFIPLSSALAASGHSVAKRRVARDRIRDVEPVAVEERASQQKIICGSDGSISYDPPQFFGKVTCYKRVEIVSTKVITSTAKKTKTITAPRGTITQTSFTTTTTTITETPIAASTTITSSTTQTIISTSTISSTTTIPVTTTSTSFAPQPTTYAACAQNNIVSFVDSKRIFNIVTTDPDNGFSFGNATTDAYSCCVQCVQNGNCGSSTFHPASGTCYFFPLAGATCDPTADTGSFSTQTGRSKQNYQPAVHRIEAPPTLNIVEIKMARIIQRKPIPKGSPEFEANRHQIVQSVLDKIPKDLVLPDSLIDNPPLDVTTIPQSCGLLTQEELDITENYDLVALSEAIASRKFTSVQVTSAFCRRAAIAHQLTFCLTEFYMNEALEQARQLDEHLERTGKVVGPLHGVPISIKEMVPVKGQLVSLGLIVTRAISEQDCYLVEIFRKLGAVFYVKTHQPTAVFSMESMSFLGRTLNPHNIDLAPGGSSGGEAALLALKGSVIGVGTDIGGSIRLPASFCGTYGLKGSSGFWPGEGLLSTPFPAGVMVDGIIGPLGRTLRDIDYICRLVRGAKPWLRDPEVLPGPYTGLKTTGLEKSSLKIGFLEHYDLVQPQPPVKQAMDWVQSHLKSSGFKVSPFKFHEPAKAHKIYGSLVVADGWSTVRGALQGGNEPPTPVLDALVADMVAQDDKAGDGQVEPATVVIDNKFVRDGYRSQVLADWIAQDDPDVIITPMSPATAHDTANLKNTASATHFYNLIDYPAIIVPTPIKAQLREKEDSREYHESKPWNAADQETKQLWKDFNYEGAPVCVQIVAKRHMENELIAAVGLLQEALQLP
ncbi:hypothetical protein PRZ48_000593 [Zasmidium cellare]|uniref:amidase n=1 Tax=Zasmidium cellare TaxID=395010 RepID=A0ABR0F086_ZASCE|nr:hypothetical protein PRZ48_000593 [Zasmidium cellare]